MDLITLLKLAGAGGITSAGVVAYLFISGAVVPGYALKQANEEKERERVAREKAEQRLIDSMPVLKRAGEVVERSVGLASEAVETVKKSNGQAQ